MTHRLNLQKEVRSKDDFFPSERNFVFGLNFAKSGPSERREHNAVLTP